MKLSLFTFGVLLAGLLQSTARADAVDRIAMERLKATHEQVEAYQAKLSPVKLNSGYDDVRAILHAHSYLSHDSVGTIDEIIEAAHATNVRVIMFSNHPADTYDYFEDTEKGMHDGVLLIPGAETGGMLVYPTHSMKGHPATPPQPFVDLLHEDGGLTFISHLESKLDWELERLTGSEIYNTHADFMEERRFLAMFRNPVALFKLMPALKRYPQETFAAIQDYPADYLKAWDRWCQRAPHTGVAANDSHHNQAYRGTVTTDGQLLIEDALGKKVAKLDPEKIPLVKLLIGKRALGTKILDIDLDPYDRSFRHVSTHLLMNEITRKSVWEALRAGRAYVAFDWMADPTGFVYLAEQPTNKTGDATPKRWPMGSELPWVAGLELRAEAALPVDWKLVRNSHVLSRSKGKTFDFDVQEPGVYRVEAWLKFVGEPRLWVLSNPIYIRPAEATTGA